MKAPLGEVQAHSIGEIKNVIVDRIEEIEPPLAHMIPEGSGHLVLPAVSLIALFLLDFRVAFGSLLSLPIGFAFMLITFAISGKSMEKYMKDFLWERVEEGHGSHLVNWDAMGRPMSQGV